MTDSYVVKAQDADSVRRIKMLINAVEPISIDFSPWAEDGGAITSATWTVKSGNVGVSAQALASNVASAVLTASEAGTSMIEVLGAGATHTKPFRLSVYVVDPQRAGNDYEFGT